jgi:lipopolysaccharide transport system ATP-binding protein
MYVRLAFVVAAHLGPEILPVDEVLAVGDVQFQKKCLGKMKEVGSHRRTIVFVSHNVSAMVLAKGSSVYFSNNIQEALRQYMNPIVSTHTVDLSEHPGRTAPMVVFQEIVMYDENNQRSQLLIPGEGFAVEMKVSPPDRINNPKIAFAVTNGRGERVFAVGTYIGGTEIPHIEGASTIRVQFKMPQLVAGQYGMDLGLYDRAGMQVDKVFGATTFEVAKADYLEMTETHSHHMGNIMVRSDWKCVQYIGSDSVS